MLFEAFFRKNPEETHPEANSWRHNYALQAYRSEKFERFLDLMPTLGTINAPYFGGKETFEEMVRTAEEKTGRSIATPLVFQ